MPHYSPSRRKRRDSECCSSINLVKYMLQIFNIILLISGGALLGTALWTFFCKFHYVPLLTTSIYIVGTYALAVAGSLAFIGGILGCCGTFYEQKFVILCYTFLLALVFLLEAMIGGLAYFYETQIEDELKMTLNETFLNSYGIDEERTEAIDRMQQEYTCCGAIRFEDWTESVWFKSDNIFLLREHNDRLVPDSCCITLTENCGKRDHPSNIPYTGCVYRMSDEFRHHLTIIGAIGLGISLIHIVGLILSCCLYIRLRNFDDE